MTPTIAYVGDYNSPIPLAYRSAYNYSTRTAYRASGGLFAHAPEAAYESKVTIGSSRGQPALTHYMLLSAWATSSTYFGSNDRLPRWCSYLGTRESSYW